MTVEVGTLAVTKVDGGLTVLRLIIDEQQPFNEERIERTIAKYVDSGIWNETNGKLPVSWRIVPNDFVDESTDRTYRNAWKDSPGRNKPDHDIVKARDIHRDHLRRNRQKELDDLDLEYSKADEEGNQNKKRDVAARKQKLRDVTADPRIEAAQTVEDLKALTIEQLTN